MSLASLCTLGVGGPARRLVEGNTQDLLIQSAETALASGEPLLLLGGGSNVVLPDKGFDGLVLLVRTRGVAREQRTRGELWRIQAGEPWPELVDRSIEAGLHGLECLSGIPGTAGAAPIQNIGAYGVEISERLHELRVWDLEKHEQRLFHRDECGFRYRFSLLKGAHLAGMPSSPRYIVLEIALSLSLGTPEPPRYAELQRALGESTSPGCRQIRDAVMSLRRSKSMLYDPADPESHSAGSFFVNPVVDPSVALAIEQRARSLCLMTEQDRMPRWEAPLEDQAQPGVKLAAAWLIERSGFPRGLDRGRVGLSKHHALAIVNRGGASAAEVLGLAREIQQAVQTRFGVWLEPEPILVQAAPGARQAEP